MSDRNNTAVRHCQFPHMARLSATGKYVRVEEAERLGFRVVSAEEAKDASAQAAHDARVEQFVSLPEAAGKVRSASRLAHDNPGMTPEQGRRFLMGAPSDAAITAQRQPQATATAPADPRAARLDEIRRLGKRR